MAVERESGSASDKPGQERQPQDEVRRKGRVITAKDAGWITPTAFVLPVKFVPVDPPRRIKKKPPQAG